MKHSRIIAIGIAATVSLAAIFLSSEDDSRQPQELSDYPIDEDAQHTPPLSERISAGPARSINNSPQTSIEDSNRSIEPGPPKGDSEGRLDIAERRLERANQKTIDLFDELITLSEEERRLIHDSLLSEPLLGDEERLEKILGVARANEFREALVKMEQEGIENSASELSEQLGTEIGLDIDEREELRQMYRKVGLAGGEGGRERLWNLIRERFGEETLNRFIEVEEKQKPAETID